VIKLLFVCHGNICRSPMAEFVMRDLVGKSGLENEIICASAATSTEEIGNDIHYGTRRKLIEMGVRFERRAARQLTMADYRQYDLLLGMDGRNVTNLLRMCAGDHDGKIHRLLDYTDKPRDIADPWYTDNFDETARDVVEGCAALLRYIRREYNI